MTESVGFLFYIIADNRRKTKHHFPSVLKNLAAPLSFRARGVKIVEKGVGRFERYTRMLYNKKVCILF